MTEAVVSGGRVVDTGARGGRPPEPPPDPERAPLGWTFDKTTREWRAKKRLRRKPPDGDAMPAAGDRDPEPAHLRDAGEDRGQAAEADLARARDDLAGVLGLAGVVLLPAAERMDPVCGPALTRQWQAICEAAVPLLTRSERVVRWMTASGGGLMDWIGLGIALAPVGHAVIGHHLIRRLPGEGAAPEPGELVPAGEAGPERAAA
jgi:hypothetical protein